MRITSVLSAVIILICILFSSCQTAKVEEKVSEPVVPAVVRTIEDARFTSFGFNFSLEVTGARQLVISFPSILSADLMSEYALFFAKTGLFETAEVDSPNICILFEFENELTDSHINALINSFSSGSYSFEAYLNSRFDALDYPVYQLEMDGYILSIKQVDGSDIIVDFPGIPTMELAEAVLKAASEVSPVSLEGTKICMSSGNRVLYCTPAVFDAEQFKLVVETMTTPSAPISTPEVTSEPITEVQIPVVQTNAQPTTPPAPVQAPEPEVVSEPVEVEPQKSKEQEPGLIMLIIVLGFVLATCIAVLIKRRRK